MNVCATLVCATRNGMLVIQRNCVKLVSPGLLMSRGIPDIVVEQC